MNWIQKMPPPSTRLFLWALVIGWASCTPQSETEEPLPRIGDKYANLTIGKFIEYDADSVIYDPQPNNFIKIDTIRFQVREEIVENFREITGEQAVRIEYSERKNATQAWTKRYVYSAAVRQDNVERTEGTIKWVKMPVVMNEKTTWNAGVFMSPDYEISVADEKIAPFSKKWTATALSFGKKDTIGTKIYPDVLTTRAQTPTSITNEKRFWLEKYAKNVGLVYRELHILDTQNLDPAVSWERRAQRGFILKWTVRNHN